MIKFWSPWTTLTPGCFLQSLGCLRANKGVCYFCGAQIHKQTSLFFLKFTSPWTALRIFFGRKTPRKKKKKNLAHFGWRGGVPEVRVVISDFVSDSSRPIFFFRLMGIPGTQKKRPAFFEKWMGNGAFHSHFLTQKKDVELPLKFQPFWTNRVECFFGLPGI